MLHRAQASSFSDTQLGIVQITHQAPQQHLLRRLFAWKEPQYVLVLLDQKCSPNQNSEHIAVAHIHNFDGGVTGTERQYLAHAANAKETTRYSRHTAHNQVGAILAASACAAARAHCT